MSIGFSGVGGFDETQLTPFHLENSQTLVQAPTTLLSITGKGFLSKAMLYYYSTTYSALFKITADGTVIYLGATTNIATVMGLVPEEDINLAYSGTAVVPMFRQPTTINTIALPNAMASSFPLSTQQNGFILLNNPIYFDKSLLIEGYVGTNNTISVQVALKGCKM